MRTRFFEVLLKAPQKLNCVFFFKEFYLTETQRIKFVIIGGHNHIFKIFSKVFITSDAIATALKSANSFNI